MRIVALFAAAVLFGAGVGAAAVISGCAETKEYAGTAGHAVIDCGKQDLPAVVSLLARFGAEAALAGKVDWKALEGAAKGQGLGVGSCALAEFLSALKKHPEPQVAAAGGMADVVVQGQAVLARVSGGASVKLPDGTKM